jgi:predicted nucleotidyltransferase
MRDPFPPPPPATPEELSALAAAAPGLRLLLLFGSRARGDASASSDWDFGYLAQVGFDPDELLADLIGRLNTERVDLVDLERANGLLRYRAAAEGKLLHEAAPGELERFWLDAVSFWYDAEPVLLAGYEDVLERVQQGRP